MGLLNIYVRFPPRRKWMEVLPAHSRHPSCLHSLSRAEGIELIWILDECYCFTYSTLACIFGLCCSETTRNKAPLNTKVKYLTLSAFVILFLGHILLGPYFTVLTMNSTSAQCFFWGDSSFNHWLSIYS